MNRMIIIEKVASGLRRMGPHFIPDYLLFLKSIETIWIWENKHILNIPVIYTDRILKRNDDIDCPFYPCWNNDYDYIVHVSNFRNGYVEY